MAEAVRRRPQEAIGDPYRQMAAAIILDAPKIVRGEVAVDSDCEIYKAARFLRDTKCERWCELLGIEYEAFLERLDYNELRKGTNHEIV